MFFDKMILFNFFQVLEEIDYMTRPSSSSSSNNVLTASTSATTIDDVFPRPMPTSQRDVFRPFHHVRRHRERLGLVQVPEFKPIRKRVVMSRRNLMETLQDMILRQEQNLERERAFISSELADE